MPTAGELDRAKPSIRPGRGQFDLPPVLGEEVAGPLRPLDQNDLEPYADLVDDLAGSMSADEGAAFCIDGSMTLDGLLEIVDDVYDFALTIDWASPDSLARVWYVSEEKLEPRLGERFEEPIEPYEQPLSPGRDAAAMRRDIEAWDGLPTVAAFLLRHP